MAKPSGKASERLALVDETQADRHTIEAYELITRKMRIGRVPLFFRALAAEKALLPCWQALRPAVRTRAFEEAADDLRVQAARAAVELGCPLIETQLEWAGHDLDEIDEIRGQVDVFHYQDPKLLLAAVVAFAALGKDGVGGNPRASARAQQRVPRGVPQEMEHIELVPEDSGGGLGKTFRSIRAHLELGIVPDDFRALGRWPKYLELAWSDVRKRDREPRAHEALVDLLSLAEHAATQLPARVQITAESLTAAGADPARVRALLERFRNALPGLVLDIALFKVQLDGPELARESPFPVRWKYISSDDYMTSPLDEPVKLRAGDPTSLDELDEAPEERRH
jgi:hypothetical protein